MNLMNLQHCHYLSTIIFWKNEISNVGFDFSDNFFLQKNNFRHYSNLIDYLHFFLSFQVFVITSYFNILRQTMTVFFPQGIGQVAEALVSVKRLQVLCMQI